MDVMSTWSFLFASKWLIYHFRDEVLPYETVEYPYAGDNALFLY